MGICPKNMVVHVDSPNNTALVKWSIPEGTDNTGDPIITESNGLMPNTRLPVGTHLLRYNIVDKAGNVGQPCSFLLQVKGKDNSCQSFNMFSIRMRICCTLSLIAIALNSKREVHLASLHIT